LHFNNTHTYTHTSDPIIYSFVSTSTFSLAFMKSQMYYDDVPQDGRDDRVRALDQSEREYNRMISQHMTYHASLMDNLLQLSSESGSGSNTIGQQQLNQSNQTNLIRRLGATIGNLNATEQQIMNTASDFVMDTDTNAKKVSRFNNFILQNTSKLNETVDAYQDLNKEGFTQTMDAALEVSNLMKESHKYALFIFGMVAIYALYKTTKQLQM